MQPIPFTKMHGAGNDFVVIDNRKGTFDARRFDLMKIADRSFGVGCDQIVLLENSSKADVFMRIYNADGGEVSSCGNASRCVGWMVMRESGKPSVTVETKAGILSCEGAGEEQVTVDMGAPRLGWKDIPLSDEKDTLHLGNFFEQKPLFEGLSDPVAVSMGNPHVVFFVSDVEVMSLRKFGPVLEHHPLFPARTNVEIAQVMDERRIRLRVWERGSGETLACGTGACATLVAAHLRGLTGRKAEIFLPGGVLGIEWAGTGKDGHVLMTGPVATTFTSAIDPAIYSLK